VKVRGFRVELGEIESQLGRCPGVREAVVLARPDRNGQKYLCAYVVGPDIPGNPEIRAHLARHLPDYMVPDVFVRLAELPLTANGKIDRAALPDPGADEAGLAEEYVAPQGEVETALAEIWEEVLGRRGIGARHDFFTLGGHSLSAIQVLTRVRSRFGVDLPLPGFFESPTIAGAARVIARLLARGPGQEAAEAAEGAIAPGERPERLPLSFAQERFWFLYRLDPASAAFNIGGTARLDGRLSVPALAASVDEVLRRHEALRTRFGEANGERFQVVDPFVPAGLPVADLSGLPAAVRGPETERVLQASTLRPFDLTRDRLMRPLLVRLGESSHVVHFTFHHIVGDGWSMGILLREMAALYRAFLLGLPSPLPPLPVQYPDFALWQRRWLTGERLERQLGYWRRRLAAPLPTLELPAQRPRPSTPRFHGAAETVAVPRHLAETLAGLGRAEGATPFMVFLAAFESLLHLYSGETDLLVGINVASRGRREIEDLIGFFVNNLALRTDLSGDPSFREAVRRLRDTSIEAFAHQDVPYEAVLQEVQQQGFEGHRSYAPLFQVMFVYQSFRGETGSGQGALPGVAMSAYSLPVRTANFDLTLTLNETAGDLLGLLIYDTDLFEPAFAARMAEHFRTLLEEVAADPDRPLSEIPIASENQARQLTSAFSEEL
jgi:Condensation domain/AMP-binding enzyme C-terminal domain/Phosphopantetheine attachment site